MSATPNLPPPISPGASSNVDGATVANFGDEWAAFDQTELSAQEHHDLFQSYFSIFPFDALPAGAEGFDLGCGSGRWAALVAPRVGTLHCIDPAEAALNIARRRMQDLANVDFEVATSQTMSLGPGSQDFGYSLGVLHHIPDTAAALRDCVTRLKPGAPFLLYLYYRFDNRPVWFRAIWQTSEIIRRIVSRLPSPVRRGVTTCLAAFVYWPLARSARALEKLGANVEHFPLAYYRSRSFYTMKTDALDRFGTPLEQRFTRSEITTMMMQAGLDDICFSDKAPFWVALGRRVRSA